MSTWTNTLFSPRSIAIIGASSRVDSLAGRLDRNLRTGSSQRRVHLVNPRHESLDGRPCHRDVVSIPDDVDLACILVSADKVGEAVADCGRAGVGAAIVFSSGFGEAGDGGRELEDSVLRLAREGGVRLLGPNCQGLATFDGAPMLATFSNALALDRPDHGPVAYVGQSGAIGGAVLDKARERAIGMSAWVSTGNQADLDVIKLSSAVLDRCDTKVVLLYMEGLTSGQDFLRLARKAARLGKRIVMLHVGTSERGGSAVSSHTGAMLPPGRVLRTVAREHGVQVVDDVDQLLDLAVAGCASHPTMGTRGAVVTSSGGGGIIAADRAAECGLSLPTLPQPAQERIGELVPAFAATANPVDVTTALFSGDLAQLGNDFAEVCRRVAEPAEVDVVLIVLTMIVGERAERLAAAIENLAGEIGKPVHVAWLTSLGANRLGRARLISAGIPVYDTVSAAIRVISVEAATERDRLTLMSGTETIGTTTGSVLPALDQRGPASAVAVLDAWGVPQPAWDFVTSPARPVTGRVGDGMVRYAVKGVGPTLQHKTELNAVYLHVPHDEIELRCREIADGPAGDLGLEGFLVQEMVRPGLEMLVSINRQPNGFPPLLVVGFGGVDAEVYADVVTATLPTSTELLRAMLTELRGAALLGEFRGRPARDIDAFIDLVSNLCRGFAAQPDIREVELNPVMLHEVGGGAIAVDVLLM